MNHPGIITKMWRKHAKMSIPRLAQRAKIDKGTISRFERGGDFKTRVLDAICQAFGRNSDDAYRELAEILGGSRVIDSRDDHILIIPDKKHLDLHRKLQEILDVDDDIAFGITVNVNSLHKDAIESRKPKREVAKSNIVKMPKAPDYPNIDSPQPAKFVLVRHFDRIPAGDPREMAPGSGGEWSEIVHSVAKDTWYTLRVSGDSMEPKFLDGDIVLIDFSKQPKNGDIVAALIDGSESTLKKFSRKGDQITLTPINIDQHQPRTIHASKVSIQGVFLELVRRK